MGLVGRKHKKGYFRSNKQEIDIKYQSNWELSFFKFFEKSEDVVSFDRPDFSIPYQYKNAYHKYYPDLLVEYKDGSKELIEIKPMKFVDKPRIKAKTSYAKKYCKQNNLVYKILTERQLEVI